MQTIELTQGQVTIVDDIDYDFLMRFKWYAAWHRNCFRAVRSIPVDGKQKRLHMHTAIAERMKIGPKLIDHRDQNSLNNQRTNLRSATNSQNQHNRGAPSNNKTGVKGVSLQKAIGRYQARIKLHDKRYHLGYFDTISEAEQVVIAKRVELVGEFAA